MESPSPSPSSASNPPASLLPPSDPPAALDPEFLALLACPRCADRPPLRRAESHDAGALVCTRCGRIYPVTDGFPDLRLTEEEIAAGKPAASSEGAS